jgi:hypothetical protein
MTQAEINRRLIQVAAGMRKHKHYDRTVEIARMYTAFSTGFGIDGYMKKYSRREDENLFKVRCEITHQITPSVCSNLFALLEKAYRSFYRRELTYGADEEAEKKTQEFEAMLAKYAGGMGVDGYCQERLIELNKTDPNAWIIQEWKDFDSVLEYAAPYPFEASSEMAVDFDSDWGELQYLTVQTFKENPKDAKKPLKVLTCYQNEKAVVLRQTDKTNNRPTDINAELIPGETVAIDGSDWLYLEFSTGIPIQAMRAGYKRDTLTGGETFVWPLEAAEPYLHKSLKVVSELDLTAANVAMPLTIRFGDVCNAPQCDGGHTPAGICQTCNGSGKKKSATSVLEEIVITPMPENPADMLDLSKVIHYVSPDVSILEWQEKYVDALERKCKSAVLNSEIYNRQEIAETATGKNIDQDNANDFVYKYFRFYAKFWEFTVKSYALITGKEYGLQAYIVVNKDLKLKTLNQLLADLEQANRSGAGPATRAAIEWDIMRVMTVDNEQEFIEYQVKERFNPFSGFTDEQKLVWSQSPLIPLKKRILYANLGYIFDQIEFENPNFYSMPYEQQKVLVDAKVDEVAAELTAAAPPTIEA